MSDVARGVGHSGRVAMYEVPDSQLSVGSTLGGPKVVTVIKATGALEKVWSVETGETLFGSVTLRHYDERTGMHLTAQRPGTFTIYPEHQDHDYTLLEHISVHESIFVLSGPLENGRAVDPPAVYMDVVIRNDGGEPMTLSTYAFAELRGDTGHDVCARFHKAQNALLVWNAACPERVRVFACNQKPESYETTMDYGKAVAQRCPGSLSNHTTTGADPLGVLHLSCRLEPGKATRMTFVLTFADSGVEGAEGILKACPPADEALKRTRDFYGEVLNRTVVMTPDPYINRGVLWAKANMLRIEMQAPTGWCFTNDPARSSNSVARDTAWFAMGADYVTPEFAREALLAFLERQEPSGKIVEYYDIRTGKTEDYGLNINDDTPLIVLALWHHVNVTGDHEFLRKVYPTARKAMRYVLSQRNEQGLVWCDSTGTSSWGMVGWRNIIPGYRLTGAVTEVNAECYAALRTTAEMARVLGYHDESAEFSQAAEALHEAINACLLNPENGLYYLCIGIDGIPRSEVTADLIFPLMFGVAPDDVAASIVGRLSAPDFWTEAGMRTVPQDAPGYSPDRAAGLVGGVWVGLAFWYAFAAAPYSPAFMADALSTSFRKYSSDPRGSHTVPGQFSEWLNGETLVNQGMMLSPWFPPRYVWAAVEGVAGLDAKGDTLEIVPHLAPDWKWLAVQNLPYRHTKITFFAVRMPEVVMYSNTYLQRAERARIYEEDITRFVHTDGPTVSSVGLRQGDDMVILAGSNDDTTVSTSLRIQREMSGAYDVQIFDSLLGQWRDLGVYEAGRLQDGITMQIERRGFCLIVARQKT